MKIILKIVGVVLIVFGALMAIVGLTSTAELGTAGVITSLVMAAVCICLGVFLFRKKKKAVHESEITPVIVPEVEEPKPIEKAPKVVLQPEELAPIEPKYQYYGFKVAGISYREKDIIDQIMMENDDYNLSKRELVELGLTDERIYRYIGAPSDIELISEPDNPHDDNAIKVIADGLHIGYVPAEKTGKVKMILTTKEVITIACDMYGGQYKVITEDYNDSGKEVYTVEKDKTNIGAEIAIKYL